MFPDEFHRGVTEDGHKKGTTDMEKKDLKKHPITYPPKILATKIPSGKVGKSGLRKIPKVYLIKEPIARPNATRKTCMLFHLFK